MPRDAPAADFAADYLVLRQRFPDAQRPAFDRVVLQLLRWTLEGQSDLLASYTCHLQGLARAGAHWPQEAKAQHARN